MIHLIRFLIFLWHLQTSLQAWNTNINDQTTSGVVLAYMNHHETLIFFYAGTHKFLIVSGLKKVKVVIVSRLLGRAVPVNKDQKVQPISFEPDYFVLVLRAVLEKIKVLHVKTKLTRLYNYQ